MNKPKTYIEDKIILDPVKYYADFHQRLVKGGPNTPFPEFKPVVDFLLSELDSESFSKVRSDHPDLEYEVQEVKTLLAHVNIAFVFDDKDKYPYAEPFSAPFPYRPTLDAIESALRLFDKLNRLEPNNKAVPLYHFDRYAYHRHSLVADPDVIVYPTIKDLTFFDLIRTRSVPIGFIGVFSRTVRVDRHQQSPLDFWYHDLNHVRRMHGYMTLREKQKGITTDDQKLAYYKEMDDFIVQKIVPNITQLPPNPTKEDIAVRNLVRILIFEIIHETALTAEAESIIEDLLRSSQPQPFEHMVEEEKPEDIEELRTPTGNIKSGVSVLNKSDNAPIKVRFFFDRALALLANVNNKINFGFYDDPDDPSDDVAPIDYRKPENIVAAAKKIFEILEFKDVPSDEVLLEFASSKEGSAEKFIYKGVDMDGGASATEPISGDEIISQVKALGKTVYSLFGYSLLGYEDRDQVMGEITKELEQLDPKTTIINIGATEEGIGYAYKIAKKMGFDTIGIVSTQALFYSGKFSEFVDKIYIVNDSNWGGYLPNTNKLTETTKAFLGVSDVISAHGGGENTAVTLAEADKLGISTLYSPAEMNHEIATSHAQNNHMAAPTDFHGAAYYAWEKIK